MKGLAPLFLGIFGTFAFSWIGLTVIPTWQIGHLTPESDEEGTDIYPRPQSGMFVRGEHVYAANGCVYCHSQQVRADYIADDIERKWGNRRSAPRDYIFERPVFLGKMRMGQDLANIGARAPAPEESPSPASQGAAGASPAAPSAQTPSAPWPIQTAGLPPMYSAAWHHVHLYAPRSINPDSNMPAYRVLYEKRRIAGERSAEALQLSSSDAPPAGWDVVPTYDAKCVVAYLIGLNQSHPLKEVRSVGGAPAPASSPAPAVQGASPAPAAAGSPAAAKK